MKKETHLGQKWKWFSTFLSNRQQIVGISETVTRKDFFPSMAEIGFVVSGFWNVDEPRNSWKFYPSIRFDQKQGTLHLGVNS